MPSKDPFIHKFLSRIDKLDPQSVHNHVEELAHRTSLYEEILQETNEGILMFAETGALRFINRQAIHLLGVKGPLKENTNVGHVFQDPEISAFVSKNLPKLSNKIVQDFHILSPREMTLRIYLAPLSGEGKRQILALLSNVTSEVNQAQWDEKTSRIESLVKLAAGIAHEIGNPLNSISIHLEILKKAIRDIPENKRKSLEETLEVLSSETKRLDQIIRNFLKATRRPPIRFRTENLQSPVEDALHFMKPELEGMNITVEFVRDESLPEFLMDRQRLYQAFINIIKNAMEAMPDGGKLQIRISHKDKAAFLCFKDGGTGIKEEDLPHIFDAYYTTKEEGSGLGLLTVFDAVRDHGGRVEVTSTLGKGTSFTLLLPIRKPKLQIPQQKGK